MNVRGEIISRLLAGHAVSCPGKSRKTPRSYTFPAFGTQAECLVPDPFHGIGNQKCDTPLRSEQIDFIYLSGKDRNSQSSRNLIFHFAARQTAIVQMHAQYQSYVNKDKQFTL